MPSVGLESVILVFSGHFLTTIFYLFTVNKDNDTDQTEWLHRLFGANVFRV